MGEGGGLHIVNATKTKLTKISHHSYQMAAWDNNLMSTVEAYDHNNSYIEWQEVIFTKWQDDAAEARFSDGSRDVFEVQARYKHLQVLCLVEDNNFAVGIIQKSDFASNTIPTWHPLSKGQCYDLDWNHNGEMTVALVDLRLMFDGSELEHYKSGVNKATLTSDEQKKLYKFAQVWSNYGNVDWTCVVEGIVCDQKPAAPPDSSPKDLGFEGDIHVDEGVTYTEHVEWTRTFTDTTELNFTQKIGINASFKFNGIVDVGFKQELSVSLEAGFEEKTLKSTQTTYKIDDTVELTGPGIFEIHGYVDWIDAMRYPIKMKCILTAKKDGYPVPGVMLKQLLETSKFNNGFTGNVGDSTDTSVNMTLDGLISATYGLKRHLVVQKIKPEGENVHMPAAEAVVSKIIVEEREY